MKHTIIFILAILIQISCKKEDDKTPIIPIEENANFTETETQIFNWFKNQQLPNGLVPTIEDAEYISLYDQALSAMVFMLNEDYTAAEKIFDFFDARIESELKNGVGGFSMLRNKNGEPLNHRWMGDNAWLLIALNNYRHLTGKKTYDNLGKEISNWLIALQDLDGIGDDDHNGCDGGLWAGYNANNEKLKYKVTEGNIDAYNAVAGYTDFHKDLLHFLKNTRWDDTDNNLIAYPLGQTYTYAMDLHPWSYLIFEDYPISSLTSASRYVNTQTNSISQAEVTAFAFDLDKDICWMEGTAMMALAYGKANMNEDKSYYLREMEKTLIKSTVYENSAGFPYATNAGTGFENNLLWDGSKDAYTKIAISGGAWYLFAKSNFNPFEVNHKNIPDSDKFWLD